MSDKTNETWTYAGRRPPAKGTKPIHEFIDPTGRSLIYDKGATVVGGRYSIDVERRDDGGVSAYFGSLSFVDRIDDAEQTATWESLDRATMDDLGRDAAQRRLARDSELDRAIEPLLAITRRLKNRHEAVALARIVSERITEAWWSR